MIDPRDGAATRGPSPTLTVVVPASAHAPTLDACVAAVRAADAPPEELLVVSETREPGPGAARNDGARAARGDVVVFVDADVVVHADAFARIRRAFATEPDLVAVFGSYDDAPSAPGVVSGFRNLLHHHVHHASAGPATTFWTGLGAIRRDAFLAAGGFDTALFTRPSIEDVELGARLADGGAAIRLDPAIQGTHLKAWTLRTMLETDLLARGAPWVELMLRRRTGSTALNLGWRHRLSAAVSVAGAGALLARRPAVVAASLAALVVLNAPFYALLVRRRGPLEAALGVGLHALHHLTAVAAVPVGVSRYLAGR